MYLKDDSSYTGAINSEGQHGDVYVEIEDGSTWTLTADSYISGLTVGEGSSIDLNGHKLYVDGKEYSAGSASTGAAFDISTGSGSGSGVPDGKPDDRQAPPDGGHGGPGSGSGAPPKKPSGNDKPSDTPN